jgi:hypothetical protein
VNENVPESNDVMVFRDARGCFEVYLGELRQGFAHGLQLLLYSGAK